MLVLPSVSIGNVPQLAVDLLLHTYQFELVATLDDEYLCPFAGPRDYVTELARPGVATAAQLYVLEDKWIVQLRSPPLPGAKRKWVESLKAQFEQLRPPVQGPIVVVGSANRGMNVEGGISETNDPKEPLPESGFVKQALQVWDAEAVVVWTYEGDNMADAVALARHLQTKLGLPEKPLQQPVSWTRVYGKDVPLGLEKGLYT